MLLKRSLHLLNYLWLRLSGRGFAHTLGRKFFSETRAWPPRWDCTQDHQEWEADPQPLCLAPTWAPALEGLQIRGSFWGAAGLPTQTRVWLPFKWTLTCPFPRWNHRLWFKFPSVCSWAIYQLLFNLNFLLFEICGNRWLTFLEWGSMWHDVYENAKFTIGIRYFYL